MIHAFFYHNRLQGSGIRINNWNINEIYVDETQDFTQAELYLMLHICQNPNDMFLTGDTAQGIMRGISFRFKDLRSLFYHASQKMKSINVPERVIISSVIVIMLIQNVYVQNYPF